MDKLELKEKDLLKWMKEYLEERGYVIVTKEEADLLKRQEDDLK